MTNEEKSKVTSQTEAMFEQIFKAYETAGELRDSFSSVGGDLEYELKEHCNFIRGKLYEVKAIRSKFLRDINRL